MNYLSIVDHKGNPIPTGSMGAATSDFEGASTSGRLVTWDYSSRGPNASMFGSLATLRGRARSQVRNNPLAKGGVDSYVSNLVGTDISPLWQLDNSEQKEELQQCWADSVSELDFYGTSDFYGQLDQVAMSMITDGEVLGRFRYPHESEGFLVPFQVQLLEADHLDEGYNTVHDNGNEIRYGIEWKGGRRAAYHLFEDHPGEQFLFGSAGDRVRIPARDMVHVFRPTRPGLARAGSWFASLLVLLNDVDEYDSAEVVRKKSAAMWGGFLYKDNGTFDPSQFGGQTLPTDSKNPSTTTPQRIVMKPGTFPALPNGYKVEFSEPADVGDNYRVFLKTQFLKFAKGLGITYEQLTGDLSDVNFSSIRAGLIEFRRLCDALRLRTLIFQFCRPVINRWTDYAILSRAVKSISVKEYLDNRRRFLRVHWQPQGWEYVEPVKDRIAEQMDMRNGVTSRSRIIQKRGNNIATIDKEIEQDNQRADEKGFIFDSDPRKTNSAGTYQKIIDKEAQS